MRIAEKLRGMELLKEFSKGSNDNAGNDLHDVMTDLKRVSAI